MVNKPLRSRSPSRAKKDEPANSARIDFESFVRAAMQTGKPPPPKAKKRKAKK